MAKLAEGVSVPQFLLPGVNDPDFTKEGGIVDKILQTKPFAASCKVKVRFCHQFFLNLFSNFVKKDFTDVNHGWVNRGDITNETVYENVKLAIQLALEYTKQQS